MQGVISFGTLMQSVDAGKTWQAIDAYDMKIEGNQIRAFFYNSQDSGWRCNGWLLEEKFLKTRDGGKTWAGN